MERFVISIGEDYVAVLDTGHSLVEEEGNADLFSISYVNEEDARYLAEELGDIVRLLNEQAKELESLGIVIP